MGTAAAIIIRKEKQIVRAFRNAGATNVTKAVSTSDLGVHEHVAFRLLRRREVLREAGPGRYYLDEESWERFRVRRRRLVVVLLAIVLAAWAAVYYANMHMHAR